MQTVKRKRSGEKGKPVKKRDEVVGSGEKEKKKKALGTRMTNIERVCHGRQTGTDRHKYRNI